MEFSQQGQAGEMLQEVVRPDRERMKMTSQGREFEVVQIGPDTYTNIGGQWIKSTGQGTPVARVDPNDMVESFNEGAERGDRVTRGGLGLVDGTPCQEWINTTANPLEAGTMCIGLLDNLPREFKSADGTVRMTFYDWNASITINPPI